MNHQVSDPHLKSCSNNRLWRTSMSIAERTVVLAHSCVSCCLEETHAKIRSWRPRQYFQREQSHESRPAASSKLNGHFTLPRSIQCKATIQTLEGPDLESTAVAWKSRLQARASKNDVQQSFCGLKRGTQPAMATVILSAIYKSIMLASSSLQKD